MPWAPVLRVFAGWNLQWFPGRVVLGNGWTDLRKVPDPCLGCRFKPGCQRNQLRLTERRAEERNAEGDSEHLCRRHLNVRVATRRPEAGAAEDKVIAIQQVC